MEDVNNLLSAEGIRAMKLMCLKNLDLKAKEETEMELLNKFMELAKDVCIAVGVNAFNFTLKLFRKAGS